jgi:polysaccharide deacetylase 2 family uncharacterized protein YibQ
MRSNQVNEVLTEALASGGMAKPRHTSAAPLVGGFLMATIFVAGAAAFELGRGQAAIVDAAPVSEAPHQRDILPLVRSQPMTPAPAVEPDSRPVIALVIDDAGVDPALTRRAMALGIPLTLSFLPYAETTPELARSAGQAGFDVFLHMPMEPVGLEDPGPGALTRYLSPAETAARMEWALSRVPGAIGFNNHMGSALTADATAMRAALAPVAGSELIFLDSLTTGRSRAAAVAQGLGLTTLRRDVFIDHDPSRIAESLDALAAQARRDGRAIAIGHPRTVTLSELEAWLADPANQDVRFVTIRTYLESADNPVRLAASDETMGLFGGAE